ncbi:MAG: LysM peptidoglycan-binding domain-containing protein [Chloroflexota bacterium]|nr:LysM peptidoglycan-binding domain-containing protein [Chloroflexota bacterium]
MVRIHLTRALWLVAGLLILMVVAGCYQPAGSGFEQPIFATGPTFTVDQAVVELPTQEPISLFPDATTEPVPTETPEDLPIAVEPTPSPFIPPTVAIAPTETPFVATATPAVDNQASIDAINLLLTPGLTQVADAALQDELDPFELTATFIVGQATAQAGLPLTQTAQALTGIIPATATPIGGAPGGLFPTNTPAVAGQPAQPITPGVDCIHEVQQTDPNLYRIALRYGVPVADIARASGITNINLIYVGQRLTIPGCGTTGAVPPPTSVPTTAAVNVLGDGTTTTTASVGTGGGRIHVVQQGESLFELSLQYNVPVATIAAANGIANINLIYIGQELVIP